MSESPNGKSMNPTKSLAPVWKAPNRTMHGYIDGITLLRQYSRLSSPDNSFTFDRGQSG